MALKNKPMLKLAKKEKKRGYFGTVAKVAPVFGAKAVLGDMPRKTLEGYLESRGVAKLKKMPRPSVGASIGKAVKGRALGATALGGATGIMTAPIFLKGIQLATSDKPSDKAKGVGLIAGSGAIYQGMKGFGEGYGQAKGLSKVKQFRNANAMSIARILGKAPPAVALGLAIASGRKKKKGKQPGFGTKILKPALYTAASGGVQGAINVLTKRVKKVPKGFRMRTLKKSLFTRKGLRGLKPAVGAGTAAGAFGGLVAATVVDKAVDALKKKK
jgi:hypothetical protein